MIFELREYVALPGRAEELHQRFADRTLALFKEVGLDMVGFWQQVGDAHKIFYLNRFATVAAAESFWDGFRADPRWESIKAATEQDGPLIESITITYLSAPAYLGL